MKVLIINNLASGIADGSIHDFVRALVSDGDEVVIRSTDGTTPIDSLLTDVSAFDLVVSSGGDGTMAAVMYSARYSGVPILPYPAGTGNLLTLNLASPTEPHALAKLACEGKPMRFDVGEVELEQGRLGFMLMAGAGYDATIMKAAEQTKHRLGAVSYFLAAGTNVVPQRSEIHLIIDGQDIRTEGLGVLFINFSKIQFDISFTHVNQPRDGLLDVMVLKGKNAFELLPTLFAAMLDREGKFPDRGDAVELYTGKEVFFEADPAFRVQYDGEPTAYSTPMNVRILPGAATIIVSEEGRKLFE